LKKVKTLLDYLK